MKRWIAVQLIIVMFVCSLSLNGCSSRNENTVSMGQWLALIADSFGMQSYMETKPYFKNVSEDSDYFYAFQMAAEWDILPVSDEVKSSTPVTWGEALITLVNAGEFTELTASDDEKIQFAMEHFDSSIREYWKKRPIEYTQAVKILDIAQSMWAERTFENKIENISFADGVTDFTQNEDFAYICTNDVITMSAEQAQGLQAGDVYILPGNDEQNASINKVESIEIADGVATIVNSPEFVDEQALNSIEELRIQETEKIDFSQINGIYDEQGNPITFESISNAATGVADSGADGIMTSLLYRENDAGVLQTGKFADLSWKFKVGKFEIVLSANGNSLSVEAASEEGKSNRYRTGKEKVYAKATIKDVNLTTDVDYSWGKLHSATMKLDYKVAVEGGVKKTQEGRVGKPIPDGKDGKQHLKTVFKEYKDALLTLQKEMRNSKCHEEIYICRISMLSSGLASVDFIVKGKVSASGELKLVIEKAGSEGIQYKNGNVRYIKSGDIDTDFVADGSLELTISPGFGVTILKKVSVGEVLIDVGAGVDTKMTAHLFDIEGHELYEGEAAMSAEEAQALAEEKDLVVDADDIKEFAESKNGYWKNYEAGQSVQLARGVCLEWKLYPIVRIEVPGNTLVGKIASKMGVKLEYEVMGKDSTKAKGHIDFPSGVADALKKTDATELITGLLGVNAECSYKYTPWDEKEEAEATEENTEESEDNNSDATGLVTEDTQMGAGGLQLSTVRVFLQPMQSAHIELINIPENYSASDVRVYSEDESIAQINVETGTITAGKEGITRIVVTTTDEKYKIYCAVSVTKDEKAQFNALDL